ncbi:MAG: site-2 protease family protein [Polyangiales bacterium]|nr:site-2 protease family protein [Myxococcales bacterium]MCB9661344.1 site-2 protease family protein [Sandaracinaceae bacterium]
MSRRPWGDGWPASLGLMAVTWYSVFYVGQMHEGAESLWGGYPFAVPLMSILLAHEFGHYIAARRHGVDISPPYFIPFPNFLGTMGAVISMRGRIRSRDALLDIGAAGPLAGMAVALPVLVVGVLESPIAPAPARGTLGPPDALGIPEFVGGFIQEGHSLLYDALILVLRGGIPDGYDIHLTGTALAGWAGFLVTMINLIPAGQLDGGHVAYAVFGARQDTYSRRVVAVLPWVALASSALLVLRGWWLHHGPVSMAGNVQAGLPWLVWWGFLRFITRGDNAQHPPTDDDQLSPVRRKVAWVTLLLFPLLFMPAWIRMQ